MLIPVPTGKDAVDGLEEDSKMKEEGYVLDMREIILQFLNGILHRGAIRIIHVSPSGDARLHRTSERVRRKYL
jgi:hypothetical protein